MNLRTCAFFLFVPLLLSASLLHAGSIDIGFCPASKVWSYPAESQRGIQSIVLQNVAIINHTTDPIEITSVDIDLRQGSVALDTRHIGTDELKRFAATGKGMQTAGMLRLLAFQFCGDQLIQKDTSLSGPTLQPGEAMLIMAEPFVYPGGRDSLRLHVFAKSRNQSLNAEATQPIQNGTIKTHFRFPLKGTWYAGNGPTFYTAHRWALPEEFGFDFVQLGTDISSHRGDGTRFSDFYAYGQPVMAAADGRVRMVVNNISENPKALRQPAETEAAYGQRLQEIQAELLENGTVAGNYVLIESGDNVYSLYAHLRPASITVKAGDMVTAGQTIGSLGSSGNSTEPHLHFQVCDQPNALSCAGIPVDFDGIALPFADGPRPLQSGDIVQSH